MKKGDKMLTTLKSIARKIEINGAEIKYYEPHHDEQYPIGFRCIATDKKQWYDELPLDEKKKYVSNSAYISLPSWGIEELYSYYNQNDPYSLEYTIEQIKTLLDDDHVLSKASMFALYCILHEIGHWNHFLSLGKNVYLYTNDVKQAEEVHNARTNLYLLSVRNKGKITPEVEKRARQVVKQYNDLPNEMIANKYADEHFLQTWITLGEL